MYARANRLGEQGKPIEASQLYVELISLGGAHVDKASVELERTLRGSLTGEDPEMAQAAANFLMAMPPRFHQQEPFIADIVDLASSLARSDMNWRVLLSPRLRCWSARHGSLTIQTRWKRCKKGESPCSKK